MPLAPHPAQPTLLAIRCDKGRRKVLDLQKELSRVQAQLAEALAEVERANAWEGDFQDFDEYAATEVGIDPQEARKLVRTHRQVHLAEVPLEVIELVGWPRLAAVASRLTPDNWHEEAPPLVHADLRTLKTPRRVRTKPAPEPITLENLPPNTETDRWIRAYDFPTRRRREGPWPPIELPKLLVESKRGGGFGIHAVGLVQITPIVAETLELGSTHTGVPWAQANLEFVCGYFLATFPRMEPAGFKDEQLQANMPSPVELLPDSKAVSMAQTCDVMPSQNKTDPQQRRPDDPMERTVAYPRLQYSNFPPPPEATWAVWWALGQEFRARVERARVERAIDTLPQPVGEAWQPRWYGDLSPDYLKSLRSEPPGDPRMPEAIPPPGG